MRAGDLVVGVGDQVRCSGRPVQAEDGLWLDLANVVPASANLSADWRSERSVKLINVNGELVAYGDCLQLEVSGRWQNWAIEVSSWRPVNWDDESPIPTWTNPPCPPPPGGWSTRRRPPYDPHRFDDLGVVSVAVFHPTPRQEVLVIAADDVEAVEAELTPQLSKHSCVIKAHFPAGLLDATFVVLDSHFDDWWLKSVTPRNIDTHGQPAVAATAYLVTAEMAAWADNLPDELLKLNAVIRPI